MEKNAESKLPKIGAKIDKVLDNAGPFKAFASIVIADSFMVHGIKVFTGNKGTFIGMPTRSYVDNNGETKYSDVCHSISAEMKSEIDRVVLKAYEAAIGQTDGASESNLNKSVEEELSDSEIESDTELEALNEIGLSF